MGFFDNIKQKLTGQDKRYLSGFANTNKALGQRLKVITTGNIDRDTFIEDLMITLLEADIGYKTAQKIVDKVQEEVNNYYVLNQKDIFNIVHKSLKDTYGSDEKEIVYNENGPPVILLVGVNGSGKT